MAMQFESPERLEERIAANMADESDDLSFGMGRRGTSSFASASMSASDMSFSRSRMSFAASRSQAQSQRNSQNYSQALSQALQQSRISSQSQSPSQSQSLSLSRSRSQSRSHSQSQSQSQLRSQRTENANNGKENIHSTPHASKSDQERMKAYVLKSVQRTNVLSEARRKQFSSPRRRLGEVSFNTGPSALHHVDSASQDNENDSFVSDISSTRDLTMPAKLAARANASFSGVGVIEAAATGASSRVDPVRLQGYLHKINVQLETENVALKEEKENLKRQFNRALMDCERLRMQLESKGDSPQQKGDLTVSGSRGELEDDNNALREEKADLEDRLNTALQDLENLKKTEEAKTEASRYEHGTSVTISESHNVEIEELKKEIESLKAKEVSRYDNGNSMTVMSNDNDDEVRELRKEVEALKIGQEELNDMLDERDADLRVLEERLKIEHENRHAASTTSSTNDDKETSFEVEERERQFHARLQAAQETQAELVRRLEEDAAICEELEEELLQVKEDLLLCEEELNEAKDQVVDLQIAAEEKESENIKMGMQLRQVKEKDSVEVQRLREKVTLLESQLEVAQRESIRQSTPMPRNISMLRKTIDTPRSPADLSNASWLNHESSLGDKSVLRKLAELRLKVDEAHAQTDEKVAQMGADQLAQKLLEMQENERQTKEVWKEILIDVASLEEDLRRVREESERFGSDLVRLRAEQDQTRKEARRETQKALQRGEYEEMEKKLALLQDRDAATRLRHHAECHGLFLQIRYEKAKFMRESDLRSDVIQQKKYVLNVLGGLELLDASTSQFLAAVGCNPRQKGRNAEKPSKFKVAACAVVAICRARIMARHWQETLSVKKALREAHKASKKAQS